MLLLSLLFFFFCFLFFGGVDFNFLCCLTVVGTALFVPLLLVVVLIHNFIVDFFGFVLGSQCFCVR